MLAKTAILPILCVFDFLSAVSHPFWYLRLASCLRLVACALHLNRSVVHLLLAWAWNLHNTSTIYPEWMRGHFVCVSLCCRREVSENAQLTLLPMPLTGYRSEPIMWKIARFQSLAGQSAQIYYIHNHTDSPVSNRWVAWCSKYFRLLAQTNTCPKMENDHITTFYRAVHAKLCHLLFKGHLNKITMVCPWQSTCPAFDNGTLDGKNEGERWVIAGDF